MRTPIRMLAALAAVVGCSSVAVAESELSYEDLRVQGGFAMNKGEYAAVTFMAGDIGDRDQHVIDLTSDLGIVLGARGVAGAIQAKVQNSDDVVFSELGVQFLGGLGFYLGPDDLVETLGGYQVGVSSVTGKVALDHRDGRYTGYLIELGYYHTFGKTGFQLGLVGSFENIKDSFSVESGDKIQAKAKGVDGGVSIGYRF